MIKRFIQKRNILPVLAGFLLTLNSCNYKEIADEDYPEQTVYMSTAASANLVASGTGIYDISAVALPGQAYRYIADIPGNRIDVPLGVIRTGISLDGNVNVNISLDADTISKLITPGKLLAGAEALPTGAFTIPTSVSIASGASNAVFNMSVDLPFLINNPNKKYAVAVKIATTDRLVNPKLSTTILLIDTKFLFPTATFTSATDATISDQVNFTNTSLHGLSYIWDFGDGSATSAELNPKHVYANPGPYTVKLTTLGVIGETNKALTTVTFTLPATDFTWAVDAVTPKKINFVSTSTNAVKYEWDFGDGSAKVTTSTASRTFTTSGSYNVKLTTASDNAGLYKRSKTITVVVP